MDETPVLEYWGVQTKPSFSLVKFYGISTLLDYLMSNPIYTYIVAGSINIVDPSNFFRNEMKWHRKGNDDKGKRFNQKLTFIE